MIIPVSMPDDNDRDPGVIVVNAIGQFEVWFCGECKATDETRADAETSQMLYIALRDAEQAVRE